MRPAPLHRPRNERSGLTCTSVWRRQHDLRPLARWALGHPLTQRTGLLPRGCSVEHPHHGRRCRCASGPRRGQRHALRCRRFRRGGRGGAGSATESADDRAHAIAMRVVEACRPLCSRRSQYRRAGGAIGSAQGVSHNLHRLRRGNPDCRLLACTRLTTYPGVSTVPSRHLEMTPMSVKGRIKEAAGTAKEEAFEHGKSASSRKKAKEGRNLRNEGRIEDGKAPKLPNPARAKNNHVTDKQERFMGFILWLVIGGIVGWLASIVMKRDGSQGIVLNVVVGIVGALLGGWLLGPVLGAPSINSGEISGGSLLVIPGRSDSARDRQPHLSQARSVDEQTPRGTVDQREGAYCPPELFGGPRRIRIPALNSRVKNLRRHRAASWLRLRSDYAIASQSAQH